MTDTLVPSPAATAATPVTLAEAPPPAESKPENNSIFRHARYVMAENPVTGLAFGLFALIAILALIGPYIVPHDPLASDTAAALQAPSLKHWFGTDQLGRDILSRVVVATRLDFVIAISSVALVFAAGGFAGIAAGFFGGWTDRLVSRLADTIMAFPLFVLAMGIVAALGNTVTNIVIATAIINFPLYVRVARAEANVRREAGFVQAARLSGNGDFRILLAHILPNIMPIMMVQISLTMGYAILNAAGSVVHRPRRETADAGVGHHGGGRRHQHHFRRMVDRAVSRRRADDRGLHLQFARRWFARPRRSAAEDLVCYKLRFLLPTVAMRCRYWTCAISRSNSPLVGASCAQSKRSISRSPRARPSESSVSLALANRSRLTR